MRNHLKSLSNHLISLYDYELNQPSSKEVEPGLVYEWWKQYEKTL
jgi:hypothetical protein